MHNRYRLAAFDLDGTLLPGPALIEANARAVRALAARGVLVAPATARFHEAAIRPFAGLGLETPSISCAGADVRLAGGEVVAQRAMGRATALAAAALCEARGWRASFSTPGGTYLFEREPQPRPAPLPSYLRQATTVGEMDLTDLLIALLWVPEEDPGASALASLEDTVTVKMARANDGSRLVTLTAPGVDKGSGLRLLCAALGLEPASVVVFGDSDVDLPMFEVAGLSVAMGDGEAEVRERAHHVTPPAAEGGVAWGIERVWGVA